MQHYSWRCASSHCVEGLGQRTIWFTFTSRALAAPSSIPLSQTLGVGHEQIVTDNLDLITNLLGQGLVASQSFSSRGSSMETRGVLQRGQRSMRSSQLRTSGPRTRMRRRCRTRRMQRPVPVQPARPACSQPSIASTIRSSAAALDSRWGNHPRRPGRLPGRGRAARTSGSGKPQHLRAERQSSCRSRWEQS